ncbi:MAG: AMP-binding protein [Psychromonas sp.]|nr:AMP-binding protein [Psychromonas sp.]
MKNEFWSFNGINKKNVALINESNEPVTYEQLNDAIENFIKRLPKYKNLIFLKVQNSYKSIVGYLACLRSKNPFLLIDSKIDNSLFTQLVEIYSPNYVLEELDLQLLNEGKNRFHPDLAMLLSTSGSTGTPKLVRLSHENIISNTKSIVEYLGIRQNDCIITTLPMNYSYGLSLINTHLYTGASIVLNKHSLLDPQFWDKVKKYNVVTMAGVPFSYQMLRKLDYSRFDTSSIRYLTQAGGKLDADTLLYFHQECEKLGQQFIVMYGQTEASPRMSYVPAHVGASKLNSIGIAIPNGKLFLTASDGSEINRPFVEGELTYVGPNVMLGYAESVSDLQKGDKQNKRLATGDLGYFDEDGFFYITGRTKRFIKLFGLRISLDVIDGWLLKHKIKAITVGQDDLLVICHEPAEEKQINETRKKIASTFNINLSCIKVIIIEKVPRINGGKVDYKALNSLALNC